MLNRRGLKIEPWGTEKRMKLMPGAHNAENIAMAIEELVNAYTFDKNKIIG